MPEVRILSPRPMEYTTPNNYSVCNVHGKWFAIKNKINFASAESEYEASQLCWASYFKELNEGIFECPAFKFMGGMSLITSRGENDFLRIVDAIEDGPLFAIHRKGAIINAGPKWFKAECILNFKDAATQMLLIRLVQNYLKNPEWHPQIVGENQWIGIGESLHETRIEAVVAALKALGKEQEEDGDCA